MFRSVLFLAVAAAAAPALAQSADTTYFNGPFIGGSIGWQQDRQKFYVSDPSANPGQVSNDSSAFAYGGQIGYDFNIGNQFVVGAEASISGRTGSGNFTDPFGGGYSLSVGRTIDLTARAGYLVAPQSLVYVRGGYANSEFTITDATASESQTRDGYTLGIGFEQAIMKNVSARVEYDWSDFGNSGNPGYVTDTGNTAASSSYTRHNLMVGVNFRF
jgi:outer membrane immunogenic protein